MLRTSNKYIYIYCLLKKNTFVCHKIQVPYNNKKKKLKGTSPGVSRSGCWSVDPTICLVK